MWAVLSVKEIKQSVKDGAGKFPKIEPIATDNDPAHVLVWGWKKCSKNIRKKIAHDLASKLTESNTRHWPVAPQN